MIEHQLDAWVYRDQMTTMVGVSGVDVITVLRSCLAECRDEYPPPSTVDLMFIPNDDPRDSIRDDIGGANRALQNAEWKASTVIAGAAIEALLLWAIQQPEVQERLEPAVSAAVSRGIIRSEHKHKPERWDLTQYIEIAAEMKLIRADTKSSASLAKEFRNLIHPGRQLP